MNKIEILKEMYITKIEILKEMYITKEIKSTYYKVGGGCFI